MPRFGERLRRASSATDEQPSSIEQTPDQQLADAEAALNALLGEQAQINQTLFEHQQQRHEWLRDGGDLERISALDGSAYQLKLRAEQITIQLPPLQAAVQQARVAVHEARWQDYRPVLVEAEQRLASAITELYGALTEVQAAHGAAHRAGFENRLGEFVRPPPSEPLNDYSLREFQKTADRRQLPTAVSASMPDMLIDAPLDIPPERRFTPRRVTVAEIEAISPIAPPRRVKINFGPVRTAHLNVGIARMRPGEQHIVNARAAHALVASGCAEYCDEPAIAAA